VYAFALVAWAFIGLSTTEYPDDVTNQLLEFVKVCTVMLVAVNVLTTRARLRLFFIGSMAAFFVYPLRGALQNYFLFHETLQGRAIWNAVYSNPNDLAGLSLLQLAIVLGVLETERKRWVRYMALAMAVLLPLVIVLTQSRGAFLASLAFAGILVKRNWTQVRSKIPIAIAVCVLIVIVAPDQAFRRFATIADAAKSNDTEGFMVDPNASVATEDLDQGSSAQRLLIWQVAGGIIADNPVIGVGLGAYPQTHKTYALRPEFFGARGARDTHSTYLNILAELGIVGLFFFIGIVYETVKTARASQRLAQATSPRLARQLFYLEVGLFGFLVAGIWGTYGALIPTYVYFATVYAAARLLREEVAKRAALAVPNAPPMFVRRGMTPLLGRRG
jgi:O-antigen ligase